MSLIDADCTIVDTSLYVRYYGQLELEKFHQKKSKWVSLVIRVFPRKKKILSQNE